MDPKKSSKPKTWTIYTSQEMDALNRAAADGKHQLNYSIDLPASAVIHAIPGLSHYVYLELEPSEVESGRTPEWLIELTKEQDADAALAFLYIASVLAPPVPLAPQQNYFGTIVEIDDVISKIGWDPRSASERNEMRQRIWRYIMFGVRAHVRGQRRGRKWVNPETGQEISTEISSPLWSIHEKERPEQTELFPKDEVPISVGLVISRDWAMLLSSPLTAQYLPLGEKLGSIPGSRNAGAWARVIGLSLANFWRRNPVAALNGELRPTRSELIERFTPKTGPVKDLLDSKNPHHALEYWHAALKHLADREFLEKSGEVLITPKQALAHLPRYNWGETWLNETVDLMPGATMRDAIQGRAVALTPKRGPGRPRKSDKLESEQKK